MSDLDELDRFLVDGGVLVPTELAGPLLGLLRSLVAMSGRPLDRGLVDLLQALAHADLMSARGPRGMPPRIVDGEGPWVGSSVAAERTALSARHIRRLAESGRVRARRVGRDWLIHAPSLTAYFRGAPRHDHTGDGSGS